MWSVILIKLHLAGVYFISSIAKLQSTSWIDGTAVNFILRNNIFNRVNMDWITAVPLIVFLLTWFTLFFQFSFPFLVWFERYRKPLVVAGVLIHLGIFIFIDAAWFGPIVLAVYAIFLKHEEIEVAVCIIKKKVRKFRGFLPRQQFLKKA